TDHENEPLSLHTDQDISLHVTGRATQVIHVELLWRGADENAHFSVAVPAQRGDAAGQLVIGLTGEDRIDDEGFEACIPEPTSLGSARVDISGGEGNLSRIQQNRLTELLVAACHTLFDDLDRDANELKRLLQAHGSQQLPRSSTKDV